MKKERGVTMIELVIVLIIILLISTFSIYSGNKATDQANVTEVYTEINSMRAAVNSILIKEELDNEFELIEGIHYDKKVSDIPGLETLEAFETEYEIDVINEEEYGNLYLIYGLDELENYNSSEVRNNYGLDSIKHTYLVNFVTGRVELLKSVKLADRNVRTFEQIRALVEGGSI